MKNVLVFTFYLFVAAPLAAQIADSPCPADNCFCILKKADVQAEAQHFDKALNLYFAASACDAKLAGEVEQRIVDLFDEIEKLRQKAISNERKARAAQTQARRAAEHAEAVLDKIFFYAGEFGLAYDKKSQKYGYIDKDLNPKIAFKYDEAFAFDYSGYARVKRKEIEIDEKLIDFLIDTSGNEYKLATNVNQLDSTITALDLRSIKLTALPSELSQHKQLRILYLDNWFPDSCFRALNNLQSLIMSEERYAGIKLYFDNDEPDRNTLKNTTDQAYRSTFINFYRRKPEYEEKFSAGLDGIAKQAALDSMENFFENDLRRGWEQFFYFSEELYKMMERGAYIVLHLRGFDAPLGNRQYSFNLASRRIASVKNHFLTFDGGIYKKFMENGQLVIKAELIGDSRAPRDISRNIGDERNSIYNPRAMRERRVEIIGYYHNPISPHK